MIKKIDIEIKKALTEVDKLIPNKKDIDKWVKTEELYLLEFIDCMIETEY